MKILFTGASSFTGFWFVKELVKCGHEVVSVFTGSAESYLGIRQKRIEILKDYSLNIYNCSFGSEQFLHLISQADHWDLLCHHASNATDYKSPDFDPIAALQQNAHQLSDVLKALKDKNCTKILLTGSVFEQDEGVAGGTKRAFSPYGLSKGLTYQLFRYYCEVFGFQLGKFVIPNPFGPYEEPRFTGYLIKNWMQKKVAVVSTPKYVRDNIPVNLLSMGYAWQAEELMKEPSDLILNPSCYPESQGAFAERFAKEMRQRLSLPCELDFVNQREFLEPPVRINSDLLSVKFPQWEESAFWDSLAAYYQNFYASEMQLVEK